MAISLFTCTLAINFADYSTQTYAAYTTSSFKQHSAMSAARVVMNIARIAAYPVIAKLGDVSILTFSVQNFQIGTCHSKLHSLRYLEERICLLCHYLHRC